MNVRDEIDETMDQQKFFMLSMAYLCSDEDLIMQYRFFGWKCNINKSDNGVKNRLDLLGISDAGSLKNKINWFLLAGFRKEFNQKACFLRSLSKEEKKECIQSLPKNGKQYKKLFIANYYIDKLSQEGIAAYDYSWCCYLYFAGNALGYISDYELWGLVREAVQSIQKAYSGWEDYVTAYAAGAQFHALDTEFNFIKKNSKFFERYFLSQESPANSIEWGIEL